MFKIASLKDDLVEDVSKEDVERAVGIINMANPLLDRIYNKLLKIPQVEAAMKVYKAA